MKTWIDIGKAAVRLVTAMSVGQVVQNVAMFTAPKGITKLGRLSLSYGAFVLGSMVGDAAGKYVVEELDTMIKKKEEPSDTSDETLK